MARPSEYNSEIVDRICAEIASGSNLNQLCQEDEYPAHSTVYKWLEEHSEFSDKYARARMRRADARSDRLDDLKRGVIQGLIPADAARVAADIEKWQAGKENSSRYGDKQDLNISGKLETISDDKLESKLTELLGKAGVVGAVKGEGQTEA